MRLGAGKRKGSAFEREVAKKLSLWLTGGADQTQLIRSVLSGGWAGRAGGFRQVGDLAPNGPIGERFRRLFAVECKHQRDISLWQLWTGGKLIGWWDKLSKEAEAAGVWPLLVVRENGRPITVIATERIHELGGTGPIVSRMDAWWCGMFAFPLDELLQCDPECFLSPE